MSDIWKYFDKSSNDKALCNVCGKKFYRTDGSTKGMWRHLEAKHREQFTELKSGNLLQKQEQKKQQRIDNFVVPKKNELEEAEETIVRIMIRQNNSFLFFEDPDLRNLTKKAFPNLEFGGRDYFRRKVIPRMADQIRRAIQTGIGDKHFAITSDGWSKPTHSPQLQSLTIDWIDDNFCRNDAVLGAFPMDEFFHSGEVIAEGIANCLTENGFSLNKIVCCVRDDARNMQSATRQLDKDSFQCCCHFFNLVIQDSLKNQCLSEIILKAKEWTKECRKPKIKKCMERHQEQLNMPKKQLIMSVPTRWNSTYRMLAAFKEQKKVLMAMQFERDQRNAGILSAPKKPRMAEMEIISSSLPSISFKDFELLRQICPILKIFDTETQKVNFFEDEF